MVYTIYMATHPRACACIIQRFLIYYYSPCVGTEPRPPPNSVPSEWYNDNFSLGQDVSVSNQIVLDTSTSDSNFLSSVRPLTVKVRTRSNSSLETRPNMFGSQVHTPTHTTHTHHTHAHTPHTHHTHPHTTHTLSHQVAL